MESFRLLQRRMLQQMFQARPLRQSSRQLHQISQPPFRTRPLRNTNAKRSFHQQSSLKPSTLINRIRHFSRAFRRHQSTTTAANENLSLSQRLKKLSREYGWSAVGVYLALSALDFPFCFLAVRLLGTDRIGHWEHVIVTYIKELLKWPIPQSMQEEAHDAKENAKELLEGPKKRLLEEADKNATSQVQRSGAGSEMRILEEGEAYGVEDHGYKEALQANTGSNASLWTQLALAYAIHKSFIFVRVPLTAAVTPKVVKTLRGWGWNIGKMPKRKGIADSKTGVNTKGSGVKTDN